MPQTPPRASLEVLRLRQLFWNVRELTEGSPRKEGRQGLRRNKHPKIQHLIETDSEASDILVNSLAIIKR